MRFMSSFKVFSMSSSMDWSGEIGFICQNKKNIYIECVFGNRHEQGTVPEYSGGELLEVCHDLPSP